MEERKNWEREKREEIVGEERERQGEDEENRERAKNYGEKVRSEKKESVMRERQDKR